MSLLLPALRFAFLGGLLYFVGRVVAAVLADLDVRAVPHAAARTVLVIEFPDRHRGREFLVSGEAVIGRGPGCAVVLPDDYASARHARVFERRGRVWVEDLGSTNGTVLNGRRVTRPAMLRSGDRLQIGRTMLAFRVEPPPGVPPEEEIRAQAGGR
jgi:pSer/pThr/pTyr-binding forkhead associated (FHA) protein